MCVHVMRTQLDLVQSCPEGRTDRQADSPVRSGPVSDLESVLSVILFFLMSLILSSQLIGMASRCQHSQNVQCKTNSAVSRHCGVECSNEFTLCDHKSTSHRRGMLYCIAHWSKYSMQHKFCSVGDISISVLVKTQAMKIAIIIANLRVLSSKLMGRGIKGFYWEYFMFLICQTLPIPSWTWRHTDHRMLDMQTGSYSSKLILKKTRPEFTKMYAEI